MTNIERRRIVKGAAWAVPAQEFWADPQQVVGMWPVFTDANGGMWNHKNPVTKVTVHGITDQDEVL